MIKITYLFLAAMIVQLFGTNGLQAQLQCKNVTSKDGQMEVCKHARGGDASRRFWDNEQREGYFEAVGPEGNVLVRYDLRKFAGHASVYVSYHSNGQVHRLEYSSAPDGGIQFWHIIHHFDESGKEVSKVDLSQPDGHPVLMMPEEFRPAETPSVVVVPKVQVPTFITYVSITNCTGKKIQMTYQSDLNDRSIARQLVLQDGDDLALDTIIKELRPHLPSKHCIKLDARNSKRYEVQQLMSAPDHVQWVLMRKPKIRKV